MGWIEKVEPKAIPNLHILSLHQLKSLLLSSPKADKNKCARERMFQRDFICFAFPPRHPIRTSGDEARPHLFGAKKKGYLQCPKALSRDLSLWGRMGWKELMSGRKTEGGSYVAGGKKRSREVVKKTGCVGGRRGGKIREEMSGSLANTFNLKKLCDANCTSGRASSRFSADWQRRSEVLYIIQWPPWCCH